MKQQEEEEAFENAQKDMTLETIELIPMSSFKNEEKLCKKDHHENVNWKFNAIPAMPSIRKTSPNKYTHNISFEGQQCQSLSYDEGSNEEEERQSQFVRYYSEFQEVYRKKLGFGTSWIGHRQHYCSIFVDPQRIQKRNLSYYNPDSPFQTENTSSQSSQFDSQFQSGNLFSVYRVDKDEYDLLLQNDINTKGNTQWFYFRLSNPPKNRLVTLNIVNFRKSDSLFNYGLMPCIYSIQESKKTKKGWYRGGKNIRYFKNDHLVEGSKRNYYTLTFSISTPYQKDTLLIAHSYPYTLSDLNLYLDSLFKIKYKKQLLERQTLINTVGRNKVEVISICQSTSKGKNKPLIFVIARQHPGQTPGSFVCQGLFDYFLSKDKESDYLRKNYEIKIIPMVNPDGVVAGNYRSNLSGYDLNRRWDGGKGAKNLHQATHIKRYIAQLSKGREIAFILDLHGHSRKMFSFFYGNPNPSNPVEPRVFPLICSKMGANMIRFEDSTFTSQDGKRNTARIQLSSTCKIPTVYTYQVSFFGYMLKNKQKEHFTIETMKQLGQILGKSLFILLRGKQIFPNNPDNKEIVTYKKCVNELKNNEYLLKMGECENSGSESDPEQCEVREVEEQKLEQNDDYFCVKPAPKVKIVRKIVKKEPPVKQVYKSLRQMQVLDIAQVHSAFPSNIIALIPTSFVNKIKVKTWANAHIQTDDNPLFKIYESCKQQQSNYNMHLSTQLPPYQQETIDNRSKISSLSQRPSLIARPRTTFSSIDGRDNQPFSMKNQRKTKDFRRETVSANKKPITKPRTQQSAVQTVLSFARWTPPALPKYQSQCPVSHLNTLNSFKVRLSVEADILEQKTIDPSYSTIVTGRSNLDPKSAAKSISKNIIDNLKLRRKNLA